MTETNAQRPTVTRAGEAAPACEACGHDLSVHDATSGRFCRASVSGGLDRNCICSLPADIDPGRSGSVMYGRGRASGR